MTKSLLDRLHFRPAPKWTAFLLHRTVLLAIDAGIFIAAIWFNNGIRASVVTGSLMIAAGIFLRCASAASRNEAGIPAIVGIYRYMRAPYLSGSAFVWVGAAIAARNFGLLMVALSLVGIWGGWFIIAAERRGIKVEHVIRMAYLRDVPMLLPQLVPFQYEGMKLDASARNQLFSHQGIFREWSAILMLLVLISGFWGSLKFMSMNREIAGLCTLSIFLVILYRVYRDFLARSRQDHHSMLRI